jgi:hypothetical protein
MGAAEDEFEAAAINASYRQHLHDLGLTRLRYSKPKCGELPEMDDKTGMIKVSGTDVTRLSRMLLRCLNLIPDWYECQIIFGLSASLLTVDAYRHFLAERRKLICERLNQYLEQSRSFQG